MAKSDKSNKMYQNFPQFFMLLFAMQIFATLSISTPDFQKRTKSVAGGKKRAPHPRVFAWNFVHSGQKFCRKTIKTNRRFRLLKRTCHFVHNKNRKRVLLLFEHCPIVWRLWSNTVIGRLDSIQKRAIKWINDDFGCSYRSNNLLYYTHCKQLSILPIRYRFDLHDWKLFHLIVHNISCTNLLSYLHFFQGQSRLRFSHLDHLSLVISIWCHPSI